MAAGARSPQFAGDMAVPAGNGGDAAYPTAVAAVLPVLVMVILRATPLTASASDATLVLSVVGVWGGTPGFWGGTPGFSPLLVSSPPQLATAMAITITSREYENSVFKTTLDSEFGEKFYLGATFAGLHLIEWLSFRFDPKQAFMVRPGSSREVERGLCRRI